MRPIILYVVNTKAKLLLENMQIAFNANLESMQKRSFIIYLLCFFKYVSF